MSSCYSRTTSTNLKSACDRVGGVSAAGIHYLVFAFIYLFFFSADAPADFFGQNPSFSRVAQASALPTLWEK